MSSNHIINRYRRGGAVAPLTVLSLALLVAMAALVIDGGTLMEARRHVQAAADAAAMAGANDLYVNYPVNAGLDYGSASGSALAAAAANGFSTTNGQSNIVVTTAGGTYQSGPNAGQTIPPGYIEVLIQYNAPHLFSGVLGNGTSTVSARAVARGRTVPLVPSGLSALKLNIAAGLTLSGGGLLSGPTKLIVNGGVQVNSSYGQAVSISGNVQLAASQISLNPSVGGLLSGILALVLDLLGGPAPTFVSTPPAPDPLRFLPAPTMPTQTYTNVSCSSGIVPLYPGTYNGGIRVNGTATVTLHANSDGTPGIYYLNGPNGLQISESAKVTTAINESAGVMIYNNWSDSSDTIKVSGNASLNLTPPASGPYRGLSIFQRRGSAGSGGQAPTVTLGGGGSISLTGTTYAAYAHVTLSGTSSLKATCGQILSDSLSVSGGVTINLDPTGPYIANQRVLGLVE